MAGFWKRAWAAAAIAVTSWAVGATAAQAQATDACPNGWSPEAAVEFAPPVRAVESGVANRERAGGCTLLDDIWAAEPFASHRAFVRHVERAPTRSWRSSRSGRATSSSTTPSSIRTSTSCPTPR